MALVGPIRDLAKSSGYVRQCAERSYQSVGTVEQSLARAFDSLHPVCEVLKNGLNLREC